MPRCSTTATIDGFVLGGSKRVGMSIFDGSHATVRGCRVTANVGEAGLNFGGGVIVLDAEATFVHCEISDNRTSISGGGIDVRNRADVTMEDCLITGNAANARGGVSVADASLTMKRCVIAGNMLLSGGGMIYGQDAVMMLENRLLSGNLSDTGNQIVDTMQDIPAIF